MKSHPLRERTSKVKIEDFARPWEPGSGLGPWLENLPRILAGNDFRKVVENIVRAVKSEKVVLLGMGAHAIKVGLNPVIIDLLERRVVTALAMNGAGIIHDSELAMVGHTSEDVSVRLGEGKFGMTDEPARFLNQAIIEGADRGLGLGEAIGSRLVEENFPYNHVSILATAYKLHIPVSVHVAIGTDTIHAHPSVDGAAIGKTSHHDFRLFAALVSRLEEGVFINLGSAVIIPEVFLKALTLVRNLGHEVKRMTTVNMDFLKQYRPLTNVVHRPTLEGGEGYFLVGHHEIMFPLLAAAVMEGLAGC
ncbi:MAG: hypothetical protein KKE57_03355 [Proteobacteria bacterium]|nr:hypothetical protein [Pseudomonadota bacterium]